MSTRTPSPTRTVPPDPARTTATPDRLRTGRGAVVARVAAGWWAAAATVTLVVALSGRTLPVGDASGEIGVPLQHVDARDLTLWIGVLAVVGALVALACLRAPVAAVSAASRRVRITVDAAGGVVLAGVLALTDLTVLARLGYLPILLILAPFDDRFRDALLHKMVTGVSTFQTAALVGGALLAVALVRFDRASRAACAPCGRRSDGRDPAWTTPAGAARWGRVATIAAALVPVVYATTRLAWVAGLSLGLSKDEIQGMRDSGASLAALGLGGFAVVGAILTLGLTQRWGERFPRWALGLAGRRVPVSLAVVPATIVAVAVMPAGLTLIAGLVDGDLHLGHGGVASFGPAFLWPAWSVLLGAATYAYWLRRRGTCQVCHRG
ncbi:hypothetical protein GCM10023221_20690 [Luteimicrobium xylanilyticum]|uniref:Uncharacterized protein n=1 Tax=Luteimicrobium xylanilyticum TaxID=1133546 RepID=A0A5P9Q6G9_9MICO|nr:hypothetical protein [Luteimicrobium xylanilyticum]QFU96997.1 hypothetical protein KDY119_00490 [Luteimicrobium xylanilyticum]